MAIEWTDYESDSHALIRTSTPLVIGMHVRKRYDGSWVQSIGIPGWTFNAHECADRDAGKSAAVAAARKMLTEALEEVDGAIAGGGEG